MTVAEVGRDRSHGDRIGRNATSGVLERLAEKRRTLDVHGQNLVERIPSTPLRVRRALHLAGIPIATRVAAVSLD